MALFIQKCKENFYYHVKFHTPGGGGVKTLETKPSDLYRKYSEPDLGVTDNQRLISRVIEFSHIHISNNVIHILDH